MKAQEWLDKKYPQDKRFNIEELDISNKGLGRQLKGPLNLAGFSNLKKFDCSNNLITRLDWNSFSSKEKLIDLRLSNNDLLDNQELTCFSDFINLRKLYLGTTEPDKIRKGIYNHFTGSLKPLKDLKRLEELAISNTDIDSGWEHLPDSLEKIYCDNVQGDKAGCEKIREEFEKYLRENKLTGRKYYYLPPWRRDQTQKTTGEAFLPLVKVPFLKPAEMKVQEWLDQNYPKKGRIRVIELDISSSETGEKNLLKGPLDLTDFKDLVVLDCAGQRITKLELGDHPQLEYLCCDNNQITELNVSNFPSLIEVYCSGNKLANLTISNCPQLAKLNCSNNYLTSFDFYELDEKKLIHLGLKNNIFSRCGLSELTPFINLRSIDISNNNGQVEIKRGNYNHFHGSLKSLKNMTRLEFLNIEATDIDSGLEYLPESLEEFYCASYNTPTRVSKIEETLKTVPPQERVFVATESVIEELIPLKEEEISLPEISNYLENLKRWRDINSHLVQQAKMEVTQPKEVIQKQLESLNNKEEELKEILEQCKERKSSLIDEEIDKFKKTNALKSMFHKVKNVATRQQLESELQIIEKEITFLEKKVGRLHEKIRVKKIELEKSQITQPQEPELVAQIEQN